MKRKYWRCQDCKYHISNNPDGLREELKEEGIEEPCDTPKTTIMAYTYPQMDSWKETCLVPKDGCRGKS